MDAIMLPRDDNPRTEFNETERRIRLICTDCEPEFAVTDRDVSYWDAMPGDMVEKDGELRAAEDMAAWFTHMSKVHGIAPSDEQLEAINAYLSTRKGLA